MFQVHYTTASGANEIVGKRKPTLFPTRADAEREAAWLRNFQPRPQSVTIVPIEGWKSRAGARNQLPGLACAICGHMEHTK